MISVSVIIPVKNGAATIERCLASIFGQTIAQQLEVIVIDSGSSDNSIEIINRFEVSIVKIDPASFDHGETRNLALQYAKGNFLYYTVQDACIASDSMLEKMLRHFDDNNVQAVCGSQAVPHDADKNPVDWYKPVSDTGIVRLHFSSQEQFDQLSAQRKTEVCGLDDVNAMYRRSALMQLPFERCDFGEDMTWCKSALRKGFVLIRDTSLVTWHYHFRSYQYQFKIRLTTGYFHYKEFDFIPSSPSVSGRLKFIAAKLIKHSPVTVFKKIYWFFHNLNILVADIQAIKLLQKAATSGGITAVKKLYLEKSNKQLMGRQKGQADIG